MNNLYHKVAVVSVCTTLGFALGANKEVKAATFTFVPYYSSTIIDHSRPTGQDGIDGQGDEYYPTLYPSVEIRSNFEARASYQFSILDALPLLSNSVIRQAIVEVRINSRITNFPNFLSIIGYLGGRPGIGDFQHGVPLNSVVDISSSSADDILRFDVTPFFNDLFSSDFGPSPDVGFTIRANNFGGVTLNASDNNSSLVIEAEPIPEPTTIFGSVLALSLGGWLKRKNLSQNNKTTSQI
jgi:hypothetical protein